MILVGPAACSFILLVYSMQIEATACWRRGVARVVNGNYDIVFIPSVGAI